LQSVGKGQALHVKAKEDFTEPSPDEGLLLRQVNDEWFIYGPGTYIPRPEVEVIALRGPHPIGKNQALHIKAAKLLVDWKGKERKPGEEWLIKDVPEYLPTVNERVVGTVNPVTLNNSTALHLKYSIQCCL
jgi:major vault protein